MDYETDANEIKEIERKERKKITRKTAHPLPDPRMSVSKQVQILKAICASSNKGEKFVTAKEIAPLAGVHETQAGGVCGFFYKIELLERDKYAYKPKDIINRFCNELEWSPETAGKILMEGFNETWFGRNIKGYFQVHKEATKEELIKNLGRIAEADKYHEKALSILIDFIEYSTIIKFDEDKKKYSSSDTASISKKEDNIISSEKNDSVNSANNLSEGTKKSDSDAIKVNNSSRIGTTVNVNLDVKFSEETDPVELANKIKKFKELMK